MVARDRGGVGHSSHHAAHAARRLHRFRAAAGRGGQGLGPAREIHASSGYGSVDATTTLLAGDARAVWVRWPGGRTTETPVPPGAAEIEVVPAPATGTLSRLDAMAVGVAAWRLGAGRSRKEDDVSPTAGVVWRATVGEPVEQGQPLLELHLPPDLGL